MRLRITYLAWEEGYKTMKDVHYEATDCSAVGGVLHISRGDDDIAGFGDGQWVSFEWVDLVSTPLPASS